MEYLLIGLRSSNLQLSQGRTPAG